MEKTTTAGNLKIVSTGPGTNFYDAVLVAAAEGGRLPSLSEILVNSGNKKVRPGHTYWTEGKGLVDDGFLRIERDGRLTSVENEDWIALPDSERAIANAGEGHVHVTKTSVVCDGKRMMAMVVSAEAGDGWAFDEVLVAEGGNLDEDYIREVKERALLEAKLENRMEKKLEAKVTSEIRELLR